MTKRQIKLLAKASYVKNDLDSLKTNKIAKRLTREDLKKYLRTLKSIEKQKTVTVIVPEMGLSEKQGIEKKFKNLFKEKRIIIQTDPSLLVGLRIINNDLVYELSLKNTFDKINDYLLEQYD
jgi:F0F1-type ATP synthase delta subunit